MGNVAKQVGVAALGALALFFGLRAAAVLSVVLSTPQNYYLSVSRTPDGCPICPPQYFFSWETEQILTVLCSLAVLCLAWLLWLRLRPPAGQPA
jgi:hypothetical protein